MTDRIALRMPSWLGDFVMAEPVARALWLDLRDRGSEGALTLVGPPAFLELLGESLPGIRLEDGRDEGPRAYRGHALALFLNGALRSVLCALRARVPRRVGFVGGGRAPFLTDARRRAAERGGRPEGWGRRPPPRRRLPRPFGADCVELALAAGYAVAHTRPRLAVHSRADELWEARRRRLGLAPGEDYLLVAAGARASSAKGYPPDAWAQVIDELASCAAPVPVLVGGPGEEARLRAVAAGARRSRPLLLVDPVADLPELVASCARALIVLCADGGTRHVAKAVGATTLTVFGPTDPRHSADHGERESILRGCVPCGPCHLERCPLTGPARHACMRAVAPAAVAREALRLCSSPRGSGSATSRAPDRA